MSESFVIEVDTGSAGNRVLGGGTPAMNAFTLPEGCELARGVPFHDGNIGARYRGTAHPGLVVELFDTNGAYEKPDWGWIEVSIRLIAPYRPQVTVLAYARRGAFFARGNWVHARVRVYYDKVR